MWLKVLSSIRYWKYSMNMCNDTKHCAPTYIRRIRNDSTSLLIFMSTKCWSIVRLRIIFYEKILIVKWDDHNSLFSSFESFVSLIGIHTNLIILFSTLLSVRLSTGQPNAIENWTPSSLSRKIKVKETETNAIWRWK